MKIFYFIFFLIVGVFLTNNYFEGEAELIFFDVGQGDSFAFRTPEDKIILVDGGPDWSVIYFLGKWFGFRKNKIDFLILSHSHADHISALPEIIKRYEVKNIFLPSILSGFASEALLSENKNLNIISLDEDACYSLQDHCSLCIFPPNQEWTETKDENDMSLAIFLNCAGVSVFGAGDVGKKRERSLIWSEFFQSADILKVSHHGSNTSSDIDFLKALQPRLAVISVGENNSYNHPHQEVIERFKSLGVEIWRTDLQGGLKIISDNKKIYYKSH